MVVGGWRRRDEQLPVVAGVLVLALRVVDLARILGLGARWARLEDVIEDRLLSTRLLVAEWREVGLGLLGHDGHLLIVATDWLQRTSTHVE